MEAGETARDALSRELAEEFGMRVSIGTPLAPVEHAYTHLRVTLHPFLCRFVKMDPPAGAAPWRWIAPDALDTVAMPRANRKILEQLEADAFKGDDP